MARSNGQKSAEAWALAETQHWVVARRQLLEIGFSPEAVEHRVEKGRLHRIHRGVYLVGHPDMTTDRHFMAAVLACGAGAALSHESAGAHWRIRPGRAWNVIDVSVPGARHPRHGGIRVHRRSRLDVVRHRSTPVATPAATLVDLATRLSPDEIERAVNEAIVRDLTDAGALRSAVEAMTRRHGAHRLARILDKHTLVLTDSVLEQRFLRIVRAAGLPMPQTQVWLHGYRVDFYWPELGIVVETDGLRFHRTPSQQARDNARGRALALAGLLPLRFSHGEVFHEPGRVEETLRQAAAARFSRAR